MRIKQTLTAEGDSGTHDDAVPHFTAVIFDMDGTLTRPVIDFANMRRELGIPGGDIVLEQWNVAPFAALVVGDYIHDIESGCAAGTRTCFFQNEGTTFYGEHADYVVHSMPELESVILDPTH